MNRRPLIAKEAETSPRLAVMRPLGPRLEAIAPYLARIDASRWYSNFGPLVGEFEARLAARFADGAAVSTVANATLGLALALKVRADAPGLCLMPAWTFAATAHAALLAGLTPALCDVEPDQGILTPARAGALVRHGGMKFAAVVPVLAHGQPADLDAWAAFEREFEIPVVADAAAGFDTVGAAPVPLVVSLHATKALGVGEGGFFAAHDAALVARFRAATTFGFQGARESKFAAANAKISEYAAAVGLAALDGWPAARARFMGAAAHMRAALAPIPDVVLQAGWGETWIGATCLARLPRGAADRVERGLLAAGVETRRWWSRGLHREPAFRGAPRVETLTITQRLAASTLGLPFMQDLGAGEAARVASALRAALSA